jgi:hypothetical protein
MADRPTKKATAAPIAARLTDKIKISDILDKIRPVLPREFRLEVRRPDDLTVFDIILQNLKLGPTPYVEKEIAGRPAYLIVEFPPQSFGEQAYLDATGPEVSGPPFPETSPAAPKKNTSSPGEPIPNLPSSRIRMAGKSRLAFTMPADVAQLPLTLAAIMAAIRTWPQRRDVLAAPEPSSRVQPGRGLTGSWLQAVTASDDWVATSTAIISAFQTHTNDAAMKGISEAAVRVATRAASALTSTTGEDAADAINKLVAGEIDTLAQTVPALKEGDTRDLAVAALSVKAAESLSASRVSLGDDLASISRIPFLPIVLSPHQPSASVTALELPYRLIVSPIESARWLHKDQPVRDPRTGRTELWHTRLTTSAHDYGPDGESKIRAIWSPDYPIDALPLLSPPLPFRMSLDPLDRKMLVQLMAGYDEIATGSKRAYVPHASRTHRLMLSSLGALLDSEGAWTTRPAGVGLEQWRHIATLGRDHYVRVVYAGFLCPFGHHASLIKVTERKFESMNNNLNQRVAVLRQRFFIVVREPVKAFGSAGSVPGWFDFPFNQVEILTKVTPNLVAPDLPPCKLPNAGNKIYGAVPPRAAFWPMLDSSDFKFEVAATDISGNRVTFAMPLLFVGDEAN